jgi:hypothetical protein
MCEDCESVTNGWTGEFAKIECKCSCKNTGSVTDNIKNKERWQEEYQKKGDWFAEAMNGMVIDNLRDMVIKGIYLECPDCKHFLRVSSAVLTLEQLKEVARIMEDYDIDLDGKNRVPSPLDFDPDRP